MRLSLINLHNIRVFLIRVVQHLSVEVVCSTPDEVTQIDFRTIASLNK